MDSTTVTHETDALNVTPMTEPHSGQKYVTVHTDAALISTSAQAIAEIIALYRRQFGPNWMNVFTDTVRFEVRP